MVIPCILRLQSSSLQDQGVFLQVQPESKEVNGILNNLKKFPTVIQQINVFKYLQKAQ